MMQFRDLQRQYIAMKAEMDEALIKSAGSGQYIMGERVTEIEKRLAKRVGVRNCVSCANGTDALRLAMLAMGIGEGDAVFVPDFTFFATAEAVAATGATPIFTDINEEDFNMSAASLEEEICKTEREGRLRVKAVVAVDLFGQPADYPTLREICTSKGLLLIEDGAQGFGGTIEGRQACSFGDISTTSFFPAKPLGCYGDGGAVFTDNDHYAEILRSLRVHGKGKDKYDNVRIGMNSRLDAMQAEVLHVKLNHFDEELRKVQYAATLYEELLAGKEVRTPHVIQGRSSAWAQYTIRTEKREELRKRMEENGVPTMVYYPRTMSQQTAFRASGQKIQPNAAKACESVLSLPMHPYITEEEIRYIASKI